MSFALDSQHPQFEDFADFTKVEDFSYLLEIDDQIVVNNCRMTATPVGDDGAGETIKRQFELPADSQVLALYLFGEVYRYNARPLDLTARGRCVYFVHNPGQDHEPITRQEQLVSGKNSFFYWRPEGATAFHQERFGDLTTVASDPNILHESSSLRTGHRTQNILLFPEHGVPA